jgi:hypothetical protein
MVEQHDQPQIPSDDLVEFAESLNETLRQGGAGRAEQAFGLGCSLGLIPLLLVIVLLLVFKFINLILAFILLVMGALVLAGVSMLAAQQARQNGVRQVYITSVEVEINKYLAQSHLSRTRFDSLVSQVLPQDAPLQAFLNQKEQI